jgi:hypothetical protein
MIEALLRKVRITDRGVCDRRGHGIVALVPLRRGALLHDPTAVSEPRPSDYARAHLEEYDYIAGGMSNYVLLREPVLRTVAITYFLNEARGGSQANVEWLGASRSRSDPPVTAPPPALTRRCVVFARPQRRGRGLGRAGTGSCGGS